MTVPMWESKQQRDEFFDRLRALIAEYPVLATHSARSYNEDPTAQGWEEGLDRGYPQFDPNSPMFLQGIVVLINFTNMEHYEDLQIIDPYDQSHYLTQGMLNAAATMFTIGEVA